MQTIEKYEEIGMNYVNGNISDFKRQIARLSKKDILTLEWQMINNLGIEDAGHVIHRYL
jgi:hypothetical protein